MAVGIEAFRCAVGQFASIFVTLLLKKVVKTARKVHDSVVFTGEVCTGTDIAMFFAWLVLSTISSDKGIFLHNLYEHINTLNSVYQIVCGDFNCVLDNELDIINIIQRC